MLPFGDLGGCQLTRTCCAFSCIAVTFKGGDGTAQTKQFAITHHQKYHLTENILCSGRHKLINYTSTTETPKQWIQIINVAARFGILTPVLVKFRSSGDITPCDVVSGS
jgi:hypothetical protein